jgi:hypothetical protein
MPGAIVFPLLLRVESQHLFEFDELNFFLNHWLCRSPADFFESLLQERKEGNEGAAAAAAEAAAAAAAAKGLGQILSHIIHNNKALQVP